MLDNQPTQTEQIDNNDKKSSDNAFVRFFKDYTGVLILCCVTILMCRFVFSLHKIPSSSMEPTIKTESFAVAWRLPYLFGDPTPNFGDIITFKDPDTGLMLIKRVIGLPGDQIVIADGKVSRNGVELDEPYIARQGSTFAPNSVYDVPEGCVFVLGDNREHSRDSRFKETTYIPIHSLFSKELFSIYAPAIFV